jgi:hypothetical protein
MVEVEGNNRILSIDRLLSFINSLDHLTVRNRQQPQTNMLKMKNTSNQHGHKTETF